MAALQPNRFEREPRADHARVVVDVRDDRQQRLCERLHEEQRERERLARAHRVRTREHDRAVCAVRVHDEGRGEVGRERERGALRMLLEDLARRFRGDLQKLVSVRRESQ